MTIYDLFDGLDRCAPGDADSLRIACAGLAPTSQVLDAGCGTGADLPMLLALVPKGQVTAIDLAEPFIASIRARYPMVRAEVADMTHPPGGPYDLIWSGGAIYGPSVAKALTAWRSKLAPAGRVVFTDLVLRTSTPAPEVVSFFAAEGVPMRDAAALKSCVTAAGWRCRSCDLLPDRAWAAYYEPLELRLDGLTIDATTAGVAAAFRAEIALWRQHGTDYGYALVVAVPQ